MRTRTAALALAALLVGCTGASGSAGPSGTGTPERGGDPNPGASPTAAAASPSAAAPTGQTGPDAEPTEPVRTRFGGTIRIIPPALAREMRGTTWRRGCPVPMSDLRLLRFNYWGFDGVVKRGPMVVNASVADDVLSVFRQLFDARFPMKRVGLAREFREERLETDPHTRRSVTASFNCRVVVTPAGPGDEFSQHAYGLAVDVNPLQNPYVSEDGWVRNRFARPYVDRSRNEPGMIHDGDKVVRAFAEIGWEWGGDWSGGHDYMHFSLLGR